jgi:hypothetical protein
VRRCGTRMLRGAPTGGGGGVPADGGAQARSGPDLGRAGRRHDASMRRRWRRDLLPAPPAIYLRSSVAGRGRPECKHASSGDGSAMPW